MIGLPAKLFFLSVEFVKFFFQMITFHVNCAGHVAQSLDQYGPALPFLFSRSFLFSTGLRCFTLLKFFFFGVSSCFELISSGNNFISDRKINNLKFDLLGKKIGKNHIMTLRAAYPVTTRTLSLQAARKHEVDNSGGFMLSLIELLSSPSVSFSFLLGKSFLDNFFQNLNAFCAGPLTTYQYMFYQRYILQNSAAYNQLLMRSITFRKNAPPRNLSFLNIDCRGSLFVS